MARYEEAGDWASQITILNEMMGFYRNSGAVSYTHLDVYKRQHWLLEMQSWRGSRRALRMSGTRRPCSAGTMDIPRTRLYLCMR